MTFKSIISVSLNALPKSNYLVILYDNLYKNE
jgi:hypothetical protein